MLGWNVPHCIFFLITFSPALWKPQNNSENALPQENAEDLMREFYPPFSLLLIQHKPPLFLLPAHMHSQFASFCYSTWALNTHSPSSVLCPAWCGHSSSAVLNLISLFWQAHPSVYSDWAYSQLLQNVKVFNILLLNDASCMQFLDN